MRAGSPIGELEIAEWSEIISPGVMFKRDTAGITPMLHATLAHTDGRS